MSTITGNMQNIQLLRGLNQSNQGSLLSCTQDGSKADLWYTDDGSGRQRWQFTPLLTSNIPSYFQIKVVGGVSGGRVFLSCTADGATVDLWNTDDGSGRQRWQLQ